MPCLLVRRKFYSCPIVWCNYPLAISTINFSLEIDASLEITPRPTKKSQRRAKDGKATAKSGKEGACGSPCFDRGPRLIQFYYEIRINLVKAFETLCRLFDPL